jgi:hypothetical protein
LAACLVAACGEAANSTDGQSASSAATPTSAPAASTAVTGSPGAPGTQPATSTSEPQAAVPPATTTNPGVSSPDPATPTPDVSGPVDPAPAADPVDPVTTPAQVSPTDPVDVVTPQTPDGTVVEVPVTEPAGPVDMTAPEVTCSIDVLGAALTDVATVAAVTFATDLTDVTAAEIQFGPTTDYGLVAPVNLASADYRTLLLGMTQSTTYNFRVVVSNADGICESENQTIDTGTLSQSPLASAMTSEGAAEGFIFTSHGSDVIIFDKQGELVWGHTFPGMVFSAMMSFDGQYVFARDSGPFDSGSGGTIYRVNIDGSDSQTFDVPGGDHHDFAPVPGGFAYIAKQQAGECDHIYKVDVDGQNQEDVIDLINVFGHFTAQGMSRELCHCNRIHYSSDGDFFTISDREKDAVAFINGDGSVITTVGATPADDWAQHIQAEGAGTTWRVQHGHHWYADDKLLVFTNGEMGGGSSSVLHYTLNGNTATLDWQYSDAGNSSTQGDVQHLPNGNFLITASNAGVIHEIDADRNLVGSYTAGGGGGGMGGPGGGLGYSIHRPTLYGPPPGR